MIKLCEHDQCTGCMACANVCPRNAISYKYEHGFIYPGIDGKKCIECGLCMKNCPSLNNNSLVSSQRKIYACYSKDKNIRRDSSSGGMFTILASSILSSPKSLVWGSVIDNNLKVKHVMVSNEISLALLRGSKYVQSDIGNCYRRIKSLLEKGNTVVFSGTPCQVAALNKVVGNNKNNLYTIDFICHGVPSPAFFHAYCLYLEQAFQSKISSFRFRDKKKGWMFFNVKAVFENGQIYIGSWHSDPFIRGFLRDLVLRPCCYNCQYRTLERGSDITLADYWEFIHHGLWHWNNDKGVSKVIVNTLKGQKWFTKSLQLGVECFDRTESDKEIIERSLSHKCIRPEKTDIFWQDFQSKSFRYLIDNYLFPEPVSFIRRLRQILVKIPFMAPLFYCLGKVSRSVKSI